MHDGRTSSMDPSQTDVRKWRKQKFVKITNRYSGSRVRALQEIPYDGNAPLILLCGPIQLFPFEIPRCFSDPFIYYITPLQISSIFLCVILFFYAALASNIYILKKFETKLTTKRNGSKYRNK